MACSKSASRHRAANSSADPADRRTRPPRLLFNPPQPSANVRYVQVGGKRQGTLTNHAIIPWHILSSAVEPPT